MPVKTLTGPSIQAALAKARSELGDEVVLMESTPATAEAPARISVMVDSASAEATPQRTSKGRVPKPPSDGSLPVPDDEPAADEDPGGTGLGSGVGDEGESPLPGDSSGPPSDEEEDFGRVLARQQETGRGRIFPVSSSPEDADEGGTEGASPGGQSPFRDADQPRGESRTAESTGWGHHPLYDVLLDKGLRPKTATRLFDDLSDRGVDLANNAAEDLRWAFAQQLCSRIDVAGRDCGQPPLALIGPGGVGKTSLILKMATHDDLLGNGEPVVLHLQPEIDHGTAYQNPTGLYRQHGIPVQNVRTEDEMARALNRAKSFEHVLIDTPPLPLPLDEARPALRRFRHLLRPLQSLSVHFVLSATHAFDSLDAESLQHLPIRLEAASITHLDEASTWGRVVEWLTMLDLPVQFVSDGSRVPDGARAFSLKWFVDDVMDL